MTRSTVLLAAGAILAFGANSHAAIISTTQANLTSGSQILNTGTYVSGANLINANVAETVNGVNFKAMAGGYVFEGPSTTPGTFRYIAGAGQTSGIFPGGTFADANLNALLDSVLYGNASADVAVVGLNSSKTYRLQILSADNRNTSSSQNYNINSGTFTPNGGAGTYTATAGPAVGTFTVSTLGALGTHTAVIETITFTGYTAIDIRATGGGQALLNGMSLFDVTPVGVPSPAALPAGLGLLAMGAIRRRR